MNIGSGTTASVAWGGRYCSENIAVSVGLSGTESGVNYQLMYQGSPILSPLGGTGAHIYFGSQIQAGYLYHSGTDATSGCQNSMLSNAVVSINNCSTSVYSVAISRTGAKPIPVPILIFQILSAIYYSPGSPMSSAIKAVQST
jgi:hypothetical protein